MQSAKCKFSILSKPKAFMIGLFRKRAVSIQTMCITGTNKLPGPGKAVSENGMPIAFCLVHSAFSAAKWKYCTRNTDKKVSTLNSLSFERQD